MSRAKNPAEQLARELIREASFLSDKWRLWLVEQLRKDFEAADLEQHQVERLNRKMSEAVEVLQRVAKHLKLADDEALSSLTMPTFDAASERVRQGWKSRRVAKVMRGSWNLAKGIAFGDERLPVIQEREWERRESLARKRRESAFSLNGLEDWLASEPRDKTRGSYERWRKDHNRDKRAGLKPLPGQEAIRERWQLTWQEIISAVEQGHVPGEDEQEIDAESPKSPSSPAAPKAERYVLDSELRARRIREARKTKGLTLNQLALQVGTNRSHLGKIEKGVAKQPSFELVAKLAEALDLTLDDFVRP
jgi:DNA-binding XRE family transcriptional regulator